MEQTSRRSKRARVAVDYARLDSTGFSDCIRVQHKKLARAVLKFEEQPSVDNYCVAFVEANEFRDHVFSTGFRNPCVVRASHVPASALGIRLPEEELTVERIADLVGRNRQINTIDVTTQSEGPIYTMQEWVEYFAATSPRKPLLNVVSLDLDNSSLQKMVSAPTLVKELDLVDKAWPASVSPSPKVQLYTLMSVAGCFMDFHIDFGGSSVWYHVLSGRKVFLVIPPTRGNLMAFEEWASSDRQASVFFADRASGCQKLELEAGDTLLLPGGWPHCVVTPVDSLVIGGNFLSGFNLSLQLDITWHMEERLKIRSKFRFPFYKELMWHTASTYLRLLKEDSGRDVGKVTKWERDGIHSLTRWLGLWLGQVRSRYGYWDTCHFCEMKDGDDVPKEIPQPGNLLVEDLMKYTKREESDEQPLNSNACARTRIVTTYVIHHPDDTGQEFDLAQELEVCDDDEFSVERANMSQNRTKSKQLPGRTCVIFPSPKTVISCSSPKAGSLGPLKKVTKLKSDVRQRLLKKCGLDPRIPLPSPKYKAKVDRD